MKRGPCIYFVQAAWGGPVKIGTSRYEILDRRVAHLQCGSAYRLHVRKTEDGDHKRERELHKEYAKYRLSGEWFYCCDKLASYCGAVPQQSADPEALMQALTDRELPVMVERQARAALEAERKAADAKLRRRTSSRHTTNLLVGMTEGLIALGLAPEARDTLARCVDRVAVAHVHEGADVPSWYNKVATLLWEAIPEEERILKGIDLTEAAFERAA